MKNKSGKPRVLLINPPYHRLIGLKDSYLPMGPSALAAYLEKEGYDVKIYNVENYSEDLALCWSDQHLNKKLLDYHRFYHTALGSDQYYVWQEVQSVIEAFKPDIVGITTMTIKLASAWKIASIVKSVLPETSVVLGGMHPTIAPDDAFRSQDVDFLVRGEGELTLTELCRALETKENNKLSHIDGLSYRKHGKVYHNQDRSLIPNLGDLPTPAKHLSLFPNLYEPGPMGHMVTSRGCPYRCGYCGAQSMWTRKVRYKPVSAVLSEIKKTIEEFNIRDFYFWDDSFTVNRKRMIEICNAIISNDFNITWKCTTRVNLIDEERLDVMQKSGCVSIDLGVESGSQRILELIKKDITFEQVNRAIELIKSRSMTCNAFFMVGFPHETEEDIALTIKKIRELNVDNVCLSVFTPYPGCSLYEDAKTMGLIQPEHDWSKFSHHSLNNSFIKHIPEERFSELVLKCAELVDTKNSGGRMQ